MKCEELFEFAGRIWLMSEYMGQGSIKKLINKSHKKYSEEFCRYSLYKVALGLQRMHSQNVLHRDLNSNNVLCSADG